VIQRTTRCGHQPIVTLAVAGKFPVFTGLMKLRRAMVVEVSRGINAAGIVFQRRRAVRRNGAPAALLMAWRVRAGAQRRNDRANPWYESA
jgi:hypothetical protein